MPLQSLFCSCAPPHGTRSRQPSLCPFVDRFCILPVCGALRASSVYVGFFSGSTLGRWVKPPTCSPQARWMVKRELCSRGSKLGVQARVSWRKRSRKTTGRGYPLVPATQVRGKPDLRPCPPVGSCRYILPPLFGLKFLNEKRIDINFSQPPMA